jgi:hypothetical protein
MPRNQAPQKDEEGVPDKIIVNGKVTNWSCKWPEAVQLQTLVDSGVLDGKTAAEILQEYPTFQKFSHQPFAGGLRGCRDRYNKTVKTRKAYVSTAGKSKKIQRYFLWLDASLVSSSSLTNSFY